MDTPKIINPAPELERYCKELIKKIIDLDSTHLIEGMKEDRVRQLLKPRVKLIKIDTY